MILQEKSYDTAFAMVVEDDFDEVTHRDNDDYDDGCDSDQRHSEYISLYEILSKEAK